MSPRESAAHHVLGVVAVAVLIGLVGATVGLPVRSVAGEVPVAVPCRGEDRP